MANVAINGLGRIGRAVLKIVLDTPALQLVAANDVAAPETLAYLLKYDTVYGRYDKKVSCDGGRLLVGGQRLPLLGESDPARLPWARLGVDIVFECTGVFTRASDLARHLEAGAKTVILSAPAKDEAVPTVVHGVNAPGERGARIVSCASCTTNCITPLAEVMARRIGVKKAVVTAVHAYTATQRLVDAPSPHLSRGRAAAANLVPTSTGAAVATTRALPELADRFDGVAVRGPVVAGSLADVVFVAARATSVREVNQTFREEAESARYRGILGVSDDPLVSSDIIKDPRAAVVDLGMTRVVDGDLVKVMAWYDNEWGYASQLVREAVRMSRLLVRESL